MTIKIGDTVVTKSGVAEVTALTGKTVTARFLDGCSVEVAKSNFKGGAFKNPNSPTVLGLGYCGVGVWSRGKNLNLYTRWYRMFRDSIKNNVFLDPTWHSFQTFCSDVSQLSGYEEYPIFTRIPTLDDSMAYTKDTTCWTPLDVHGYLTKTPLEISNPEYAEVMQKARVKEGENFVQQYPLLDERVKHYLLAGVTPTSTSSIKPISKIGDTVETLSGTAKLVDYAGAYNVGVEFSDGTIVRCEAGQFRKGSVKNPNYRHCQGVGFTGVGKYSHRVHTRESSIWRSLIDKCYSPRGNQAMDSSWHSFQEFCKFLVTLPNYEKLKEGWCLSNFLGDKKQWTAESIVIVPRDVLAVISTVGTSTREYPVGVGRWPDNTKRQRHFYAYLSIDNKNVHLGSYFTVQEATTAYYEAKKKYVNSLLDKYAGQLDDALVKHLLGSATETTTFKFNPGNQNG
jgi:hypothetical protein